MSKDGATVGNRRAGVDEPSSTDEAALFGAALAAVVAIALVDGAWTVFDTIIGVCLASVLVAYFNLAAIAGLSARPLLETLRIRHGSWLDGVADSYLAGPVGTHAVNGHPRDVHGLHRGCDW